MTAAAPELVALHRAAQALRTALGPEDEAVAQRLEASVLRPLRDLLTGADAAAEPPPAPAGVWELARRATALRASPAAPAALLEATAALQDLALGDGAGPEATEARLAELRRLQAGLPAEIRLAPAGPYLATNVERVHDWLGRPLAPRPQLALCRCGASARKPLCDGTHARIGFSGAKHPDRVPDRRDSYRGQQLTVLDNRGTCQHSGLCTDRLPTAFRQGEATFVRPSGGRLDELIRAVRDCPSGALSYAVDGVEARAAVDFHGTREPAIEITKDGPYRVTGGIPVRDDAGEEVPRNAGASHEHCALCRCGQSLNKPFCSGMHWTAGFRDPVPDPERTPTVFEWCGGLPALTRMTRRFYETHVPQDPLLAPLFAGMSADHPERVACWLSEVFGGPPLYSRRYGGYPRMVAQHMGRGLAEEQRARWVALLLRSARETGLPADAEFRSAFAAYIEWGSRLAVENSQPGAHPPQHMPMPRWDWTTAAGPPGSRISALAPPASDAPAAVPAPPADGPVSFAAHVKPLFRERDRASMRFAFDLWALEDVRAHAEAILERLRAGSMPCDGPWPPRQVATFERWIASGKRA
jgi:CDGSH-type Zn-finger protein